MTERANRGVVQSKTSRVCQVITPLRYLWPAEVAVIKPPSELFTKFQFHSALGGTSKKYIFFVQTMERLVRYCKE